MKRIFVLFLFISSIALAKENSLSSIQTLENITDCPYMGWIQQGERWTFQDWMEDKREEIVPIL